MWGHAYPDGLPELKVRQLDDRIAAVARAHVDDVRSLGRVETPDMAELIVLIEQTRDGGFTARALGESIFTEADTVAELHDKIRDAVRCHFDDDRRPPLIRLQFVHEGPTTL